MITPHKKAEGQTLFNTGSGAVFSNITVTSSTNMSKAVYIILNAAYACQQRYRISALEALRDQALSQYNFINGIYKRYNSEMKYTCISYLDLICAAVNDEISLPFDISSILLKYYGGTHYLPAPDDFIKKVNAEWSLYKENTRRLEENYESLMSKIDKLLPLSPMVQDMIQFLTDRKHCSDIQTICRYVYTIAKKEAAV